MVFVDGAELVVILNYGTESDWVRNVCAQQTRPESSTWVCPTLR